MNTIYVLVVVTSIYHGRGPDTTLYTFQEWSTQAQCERVASHINRTGNRVSASCLPR